MKLPSWQGRFGCIYQATVLASQLEAYYDSYRLPRDTAQGHWQIRSL